MSQPLITGIAALIALAVLAPAFLVLRDREAAKRRVMSLFRKGQGPTKPPAKDHYYKPYWS
jgi:hypothetical protein